MTGLIIGAILAILFVCGFVANILYHVFKDDIFN